MKILVIAPQPFFTPRGTPFSVYFRTLVTAELGARIDLLTYGEGQDVEIEGVRIVRIPRFARLGPVKTGPSLLKAFLDVFMVLWTVAMLVRHRYEAVHAHEEAVFYCRFLKPLFRFKLIYDMHSSLPQQLTNFKFTKSKILLGSFEALENSSLRAADAVITICPELAEYATKIVPDPARHVLIENSLFDEVRLAGGSGDSEGPSPSIELPEGKRIVAYTGTFEHYQGIDLMLEAFARASERHDDAHLVAVGATEPQLDEARALAARLGIAERATLGLRIPQREAKRITAAATLLLSPRTSGTNTPLKIYEQLASGLPLVATRIRSHTQVLTDDVCILADADAASFGAGIERALDGGEEISRLVEAALALYEREYSRSAYERKLRAVLAMVS